MPAAPLGFEWIRNQIDSTWASWSGGGAVPVESRVSHMDGGGGGGNRDTYYSDEEIDKHFRDTNGYGAVVAANTEFSALALHASLWRIGEALNNGSLVVNQAAKIGSRVRIVWEEWEIELVTGGLTGIDRGLFVLNKIVEGLKAEGFSLQKSSRC